MQCTEFEKYLFEEGISLRQFASKIGMSSNHLYAVCRGHYPVSRRLIMSIQFATDGKVTEKMFLKYVKSKQKSP